MFYTRNFNYTLKFYENLIPFKLCLMRICLAAPTVFVDTTKRVKLRLLDEQKSNYRYITFQQVFINPIHDGAFSGYLRMCGKKAPLNKICHTYPAKMKLGTVLPYLKGPKNI